jgi:hypothetical protein
MRTINLDYAAAPVFRSRILGIVLLAGSIIFAAYLTNQYISLSKKADELEDKLARARHHQSQTDHTDNAHQEVTPPALSSEVAEDNRINHQLDLPWEELFNAIESTPHEHIAILGIEPDVESASIKISAEAKEATDIVYFIEDLNKTSTIKDTHLISHQIKLQDPQKPVDFVIEATWAGLSNSAQQNKTNTP